MGFKDEDKVMTIAELFTQKGYSQGIEQGIEKGKFEGKLEAAHEIALNLIRVGINVDDIAQATALSLEEVQKIKNQIH